jgi:hypothetical protein
VVLQLNPEQIPAAFKQLRSKGMAHYYELIPGLKEAVDRFLRGEEDFGDLPNGLKAFVREYEKTPSAKASVVALLKGFVSWMSASNENAFKRLEQSAASEQFPHWISQNFATNLIDQGPINVKLKALVKQMSGRDSTGFGSIEDAAAAKSKYPKRYAEFLALRKEHAKSWKAALANFVKESGKKTVPYVDLMKFFKKNGIEHSMPTGFEGNIDAAGKWYSPFDELMTGVPSSAVFPKVRMNPAYKKGSTEYICVGIRNDGTESGYFYTGATKRSNAVEKFAKVQDFAHIVKSVRNKWVQNIIKGDPGDIRTVASTVLELLFQFSARIGSRPMDHNGISSLTVGHCTLTDGGFILKYLGKDQVPTKHVFKANDALTKKILAIVTLLATNPDKKKKDFLFTYNLKTGTPKLVQAGVVTKVFRQCGAGQLSVHKLRTFHATELMKKELERVYANRVNFKNTKEAFEVLKKLAMKVGKDLNHVRRNALGESVVTPSTALANYVDVSLQVAFFQHYKLPVPKYLEKYVSSPELLMSFTYVIGEGEEGVEPPHDNDYQEETQKSEDENDEREREVQRGLDEEDAALNRRLERDSERIGVMLTKGGGGNGSYAPGDGSSGFDNQLV